MKLRKDKTDEAAREVVKTDEEWRTELSPLEYEVMRRKGTEPAFTGEYWDRHDEGIYRCRACGAELFRSDAKFESGTGWPSFTEAAVAQNVETRTDVSHMMVRTEVLCRRCGAHLGHVFPDGPGPTGDRYCINSTSLKLDPNAPS
jgi:peptide-methionine (R)-S-oxide reductase